MDWNMPQFSILKSFLQCLVKTIEVLVHLKLDQILIAFFSFWGTFHFSVCSLGYILQHTSPDSKFE